MYMVNWLAKDALSIAQMFEHLSWWQARGVVHLGPTQGRFPTLSAQNFTISFFNQYQSYDAIMMNITFLS